MLPNMKRGLAFFLSPMLLVSLIIGCGDDGGSSPTTPTTTPPTSTPDSSLTAPTIRSPGQGEQLEELKPGLEIGNATGGSGPRTYTFEVARDGAFQQIVATETGIREGLEEEEWEEARYYVNVVSEALQNLVAQVQEARALVEQLSN